jgi:ferredoxin
MMLVQISTFLLLLLGLAWLGVFAGFGMLSRSEGERRAMDISNGMSVLGSIVFFLSALLPLNEQLIVLGIVFLAILIALVLFYLPLGAVEMGDDTPTIRFDERQIMFARARLKPGTPEYESYYATYPEHKVDDEHTRLMPGLLSMKAKFADRLPFASTDASFFFTHALRDAVDGPAHPVRENYSPRKITRSIKSLAKFYGALDVGITALEPYHVYSHIGRGSGEYGVAIPLEHRFAIAFTVEMDFDKVGSAPKAAITMETGKQYVEAARTAVQLAQTIRELGYEARAHIDGNYRVIAPLVARDAGLGEIGRMSLLMTPKQGPRVRLGVVTTTLGLIPDPRQPDEALIDFCNLCKKCADNCPSRSIPFDDRQDHEGALRWKIDPDTCFRYWNAVGTDCGRCMAVCPYSHPDNWAHNFVRWGIRQSGLFRRLALWLDDLFYSKEPVEKIAPEWFQMK